MLSRLKLSGLCGCFFCLQGCIQVLPDSVVPKPQYALDFSFKKSKKDRLLKTIVVEEPQALSILNSRKIAVEQYDGGSRTTFAQNQEWETRLPEMLEMGLIQALKKTGGIKGVARFNQGVIPDYIIVSDINDFKIVYQKGREKPSVVINWQIKLLKFPERKIIATKEMRADVIVPGTTFSAILTVFNTQTSKILHDICVWVRHHIEKDK